MKERKEEIPEPIVHQEIEPELETKIVLTLAEAEELQASGKWQVVSVEMLGKDEDFHSVKKYTFVPAPPKKVWS